MFKSAASRQMATARSFMAAGNEARELRAQLAKSFLSCEAIVQEMQAIRANLPLPAASRPPLLPTGVNDDHSALPTDRVVE